MDGLYISSISKVAQKNLAECVNRTGMDQEHKDAYLARHTTIPNISEIKVDVDDAEDEGEITIRFNEDTEAVVSWSPISINIEERSEFKRGSWSLYSDHSRIDKFEIGYSENCGDAVVMEQDQAQTDDVLGFFSSQINPSEQAVLDELEQVYKILPSDSPAKKTIEQALERGRDIATIGKFGQAIMGLKSIWSETVGSIF